MMGLIKNATGKVGPGLYLVAAFELLAAVLVIAFIARKHIQRKEA